MNYVLGNNLNYTELESIIFIVYFVICSLKFYFYAVYFFIFTYFLRNFTRVFDYISSNSSKKLKILVCGV